MKPTLFISALLTALLSSCQPPHTPSPPYTIGDHPPFLNLSNILNHSSASFNTADYNNKLLVLDFMTTGCISCIRALPRLDSLQSQFGKKLQIVLVSPEKTEKVNAFLKTKRVPPNFSLPVISNDSILHSWFPHQFISHEVWIYRGKVIAITAEEYVDENNIELALSGRPFHLPLKEDKLDFDYKHPMLAMNDEVVPRPAQPSSLFYAAFNSYLQGIPQQVKWLTDSVAGYRRLLMINQPIIRLYANAFHLPALPPSYVLLNVKDSSRFVFDSAALYRDEWERANSFCYEAIMPLQYSDQLVQQKIIADLNFYCGTSAVLENRMMDCYVLKWKDQIPRPPSVDAVANLEEFRSIGSLVYRLNHSFYSLPFIDETNSRGKYQLFISKNTLTNIPALQKQLEQYGLQLLKQKRELQILVITEK